MARAVASTPARPASRAVVTPGLLLALLAYVETSSGVIQGSIIPVLPAVGERLGVDAAGLNWVNICQLLSSAVCVPVLARLGDRHGHRRLLRLTVTLTALGTVLVALAPTYPVLLVGRVLEGTLSVWLPLEFAIVRDRLPADRSGPAIARLTGCLVLGVTLGTLAVGLLARLSSDPRVLLALPAVLTLVCVPVVWRWVPESDRRAAPARPDLPGAVLLTLGLAALLVGLAQGSHLGWASVAFAAFMALAVVLLGTWAAVELRSTAPMVDLRFTCRRDVAPLYLAALGIGVALFGTQSAMATFNAADPGLGYGFGLGTIGVSLITLPTGISQFAGAWLHPRAARSLGAARAVAAAFLLAAAGYALLAACHAAIWQVVLATVIAGIGVGAVIAGLPVMVVAAADRADTGIASGVYQVARNVGGSTAGAVFAAVMTALPAAGATGRPSAGAYVTIWLICTALLLLGAALLATTPAAHSRD
ncbi:Quinolone resistance protein NorB [Streptomyces sp. RB17]|uniref:MFS transporter n=1 Tax=Streptomyces sp. RB17 TaxID=2585197 RepID=UPI00130ACDAD|nr:MFS transporter [Streptomyces sp. RB17]MQY34736.1 Quinolone resistance protein NorB [Streptomyces sp. RB17]